MTEYVMFSRQEGERFVQLTNDPLRIARSKSLDDELAIVNHTPIVHSFDLDGSECVLRMNGFSIDLDLKGNKQLAKEFAEMFLRGCGMDESYLHMVFSRIK